VQHHLEYDKHRCPREYPSATGASGDRALSGGSRHGACVGAAARSDRSASSTGRSPSATGPLTLARLAQSCFALFLTPFQQEKVVDKADMAYVPAIYEKAGQRGSSASYFGRCLGVV